MNSPSLSRRERTPPCVPSRRSAKWRNSSDVYSGRTMGMLWVLQSRLVERAGVVSPKFGCRMRPLGGAHLGVRSRAQPERAHLGARSGAQPAQGLPFDLAAPLLANPEPRADLLVALVAVL